VALREELERSGAWLFRWRSYLPLLMLAVLIISLREHEGPGRSETQDEAWEIACLTFAFLGLGIRILTIGFAPKGTSGRNTGGQVADELNTTGAYSIVRHPLYLGNFIIYLGVAAFTQLWWPIVIFALAFWIYYERIMLAEEAFLREKFGEAFDAWAERTPAFFPDFRLWKKTDVPFSVRSVLRSEYNGFFAIIIAMFTLELASDLFWRGKLEVDPLWAVTIGVGLVVLVVLRTLRKRTKLLDTEDR
jgi:protein-S-isoprenylcysteine O-methyltransferase Ste14